MQTHRAGAFVLLLCALIPSARAQYEAPLECLLMRGARAYTWVESDSQVILLEGPVTIDADRNRMTADNAVVWITPVKGAALAQDQAEIALLGQASLVQPSGITRSGPRLFVDSRVRGVIRLTAPRVGGNRAESEIYRAAAAIRPVALRPGQPGRAWLIEQPYPETRPATQPAPPVARRPVIFTAERFQTLLTPDDLVAAVLTGKVSLLQRNENGDIIELFADRAVVFTPYRSLMDIPVSEQIRAVQDAVTGVYLEGDVRIVASPADPKTEPPQRLTAQRAFYDFTTDRAVLTDVVLHTTDLKTQIPIIVRARTMRQLSRSATIREYTAEKARLSSSSFYTPSFSLGAASVYIRQRETGSELTGTETTFAAKHVTFDIGSVPVFYLPYASGTVPERWALRQLRLESSSRYGFGVLSQWGLFESLGRLPPEDLDVSYRLDYYSRRGPAVGLDARYLSGFIDQRTLEPWDFGGELTSYLIWDRGTDDLGSRRLEVDPDNDLRGRFYWRHQHFFPGDWQMQLTGGYISDPTFLEQWDTGEFRDSQPLDSSVYLKRQRDSEAITFLTSLQPNDFATVAELYQEQLEIERLPELGYRRIGDSIFDDQFTFFSANTFSALRAKPSEADLTEDLGLRLSPGLSALGDPLRGYTAAPEDDLTYRGDFRQEIDWPLTVGRFRVVPYLLGRYTQYSQSAEGGSIDRLYVGGGLRASTAFWKVDDSFQSRIFDLHRLRHVIEPRLDLYAAAQSEDRHNLLIYDEPIDAISDIAAIHLALAQRWQTKRGGPGNWRSVDFLSLSVAWNYFLSQPPEVELNPIDFRGLWFVSMPEASISRNSVNLDARWRISDSVQLLSDAYYNTDQADLATAAIGLSVRHGPRLDYYLGLRHVDEITLVDENGGEIANPLINGKRFVFDKQNLFIFSADYQLTSQYHLSIAQSYDFALQRSVRSYVGIVRRFDRFFVSIGMRMDRYDDFSAVYVNVWPEGMQAGRGVQPTQGYSP